MHCSAAATNDEGHGESTNRDPGDLEFVGLDGEEGVMRVKYLSFLCEVLEEGQIQVRFKV